MRISGFLNPGSRDVVFRLPLFRLVSGHIHFSDLCLQPLNQFLILFQKDKFVNCSRTHPSTLNLSLKLRPTRNLTIAMAETNTDPSEDEAPVPTFIWHDESPSFPAPTMQFQIAYDPEMIVDLSHPSTLYPGALNEAENQLGAAQCQEMENHTSAVCMGCWRAKVKCDRQAPCGIPHLR